MHKLWVENTEHTTALYKKDIYIIMSKTIVVFDT